MKYHIPGNEIQTKDIIKIHQEKRKKIKIYFLSIRGLL